MRAIGRGLIDPSEDVTPREAFLVLVVGVLGASLALWLLLVLLVWWVWP